MDLGSDRAITTKVRSVTVEAVLLQKTDKIPTIKFSIINTVPGAFPTIIPVSNGKIVLLTNDVADSIVVTAYTVWNGEPSDPVQMIITVSAPAPSPAPSPTPVKVFPTDGHVSLVGNVAFDITNRLRPFIPNLHELSPTDDHITKGGLTPYLKELPCAIVQDSKGNVIDSFSITTFDQIKERLGLK